MSTMNCSVSAAWSGEAMCRFVKRVLTSDDLPSATGKGSVLGLTKSLKEKLTDTLDRLHVGNTRLFYATVCQ